MVLLVLNFSGRVLDSVGCDALVHLATMALQVGSEKDFFFLEIFLFNCFLETEKLYPLVAVICPPTA